MDALVARATNPVIHNTASHTDDTGIDENECESFTRKFSTKVSSTYAHLKHQRTTYEMRPYEKGQPCSSLISKHGITENSHPADWLHACAQINCQQEMCLIHQLVPRKSVAL
eukprot:8341937-Ditylum_brightwellii.AAC.2